MASNPVPIARANVSHSRWIHIEFQPGSDLCWLENGNVGSQSVLFSQTYAVFEAVQYSFGESGSPVAFI